MSLPKRWSPRPLTELDDGALVASAVAGHAGAFEELMRRYERLIFTVVFRFCRDREAALDLTQTVFLKAWRGLQGFRGEASLKTWLVRIATREGLNARRRRSPLDAAEPLEMDAPLGRSPVQEVELLERERSGLLRRALDGIHQRYRQAIELRYAHQLSIREISAVLETSETMTKNLLFRGLRNLRRALETEAMSGGKDL